MEIDITKIPEAEAIKREVMNKYKRGLLPIILVIGHPGTGKSYSSIRLGEIISKEIKASFTIGNIVDNLLDLLRFIKSHSHCVLVIEEGSILFSSRRSMTDENVIVNKVMDSLRKKQIVCIINFPIAKTIDSHILHMSNLLLETLLINKTKGYILVKPLILQTNVSSGKTYYHKLRDNKGYDISFSYFLKPSAELCKSYEGKKDVFLDELYTNLELKHEKKLGKKGEDLEKLKPNDMFTPNQLQIWDLLFKKKIEVKKIAEIMKCTKTYIYQEAMKIRAKVGMSEENIENPKNIIKNSEKPISLNYHSAEETTK